MENSVKQQIRFFFKQKGISINSIYKELNIPQKTLNNQINGDTAVSIETVLAIINYFNDINIEWLLTKNGNMLKQENNKDIINVPNQMAGSFKDNTVRKRIVKFLMNNNTYPYAFCKETGYDEDKLDNILSMKIEVDIALLEKLKSFFPKLDMNWLITGKGNVLENTIVTQNNSHESKYIAEIEKNTELLQQNSLFKDKYIVEMEKNEQLRIEIDNLKTELFEIKKQYAEQISDAKIASRKTGTSD